MAEYVCKKTITITKTDTIFLQPDPYWQNTYYNDSSINPLVRTYGTNYCVNCYDYDGSTKIKCLLMQYDYEGYFPLDCNTAKITPFDTRIAAVGSNITTDYAILNYTFYDENNNELGVLQSKIPLYKAGTIPTAGSGTVIGSNTFTSETKIKKAVIEAYNPETLEQLSIYLHRIYINTESTVANDYIAKVGNYVAKTDDSPGPSPGGLIAEFWTTVPSSTADPGSVPSGIFTTAGTYKGLSSSVTFETSQGTVTTDCGWKLNSAGKIYYTLPGYAKLMIITRSAQQYKMAPIVSTGTLLSEETEGDITTYIYEATDSGVITRGSSQESSPIVYIKAYTE